MEKVERDGKGMMLEDGGEWVMVRFTHPGPLTGKQVLGVTIGVVVSAADKVLATTAPSTPSVGDWVDHSRPCPPSHPRLGGCWPNLEVVDALVFLAPSFCAVSCY